MNEKLITNFFSFLVVNFFHRALPRLFLISHWKSKTPAYDIYKHLKLHRKKQRRSNFKQWIINLGARKMGGKVIWSTSKKKLQQKHKQSKRRRLRARLRWNISLLLLYSAELSCFRVIFGSNQAIWKEKENWRPRNKRQWRWKILNQKNFLLFYFPASEKLFKWKVRKRAREEGRNGMK